MAREFHFRGKTLEELKKLDVREFAQFLPSRKKRTLLRTFHDIENFITRAKSKIQKKKQFRTHARDMIITPQMVGMVMYVHNGKTFLQVRVVEEMLGHRIGEFSFTRQRVKHGAAGIGATKSSASRSVK